MLYPQKERLRLKRTGKLVDASMIRFAAVGVINTLFGAAVMFVLYNFAGCSYWFSSAMNYVLGSILSFFLNKYFTFRNTERSALQVLKFIICVAACYIVAYCLAKPAVMWILSDSGKKLQENAAMLVGMCLYTVLNYFGQRFFAFSARKKA